MKIIAGNSNRPLAEAIAGELGLPLTKASIRRFADMEVFIEIHENVRGEDVFVIQPTSYPANDTVMEILILMDALKRASARRITAVIPYFGYARQDRKPGPRTPISAKLVANLISTAGADRVLTLDLHAGQIQGFFDIPTDNLFAGPIFARDIRERYKNDNLIFVSPDVGGVVRARGTARRLNADLAIVDKRRLSGSQITVEHMIGDVADRNVIIVDDMISTGGSITEAARIVREHGAKQIVIAVSHGVFCGPAIERLDGCPADRILVTDTIPLKGRAPKQLEIVTVAGLLAQAIKNLHESRSISLLFDE
jgi:ribose-phosphate pyrophosphokinase